MSVHHPGAPSPSAYRRALGETCRVDGNGLGPNLKRFGGRERVELVVRAARRRERRTAGHSRPGLLHPLRRDDLHNRSARPAVEPHRYRLPIHVEMKHGLVTSRVIGRNGGNLLAPCASDAPRSTAISSAFLILPSLVSTSLRIDPRDALAYERNDSPSRRTMAVVTSELSCRGRPMSSEQVAGQTGTVPSVGLIRADV